MQFPNLVHRTNQKSAIFDSSFTSGIKLRRPAEFLTGQLFQKPGFHREKQSGNLVFKSSQLLWVHSAHSHFAEHISFFYLQKKCKSMLSFLCVSYISMFKTPRTWKESFQQQDDFKEILRLFVTRRWVSVESRVRHRRWANHLTDDSKAAVPEQCRVWGYNGLISYFLLCQKYVTISSTK